MCDYRAISVIFFKEKKNIKTGKNYHTWGEITNIAFWPIFMRSFQKQIWVQLNNANNFKKKLSSIL